MNLPTILEALEKLKDHDHTELSVAECLSFQLRHPRTLMLLYIVKCISPVINIMPKNFDRDDLLVFELEDIVKV